MALKLSTSPEPVPHRVGAYAEGHPIGILLQVCREVHPCKVSLEVHTGDIQSFWHGKIKARSPRWAVSAAGSHHLNRLEGS